jgi:hypothetical protein
MSKLKYKQIAIDFDDTIVESDFPHIIGLKPHAKRVMDKIKSHGGEIIVWTARGQIYPVYQFLVENEIPFDAINKDFSSTVEEYDTQSRKIFADVYIDDRNLETRASGGIDWLKIESLLFDKPKVTVSMEIDGKMVELGDLNVMADTITEISSDYDDVYVPVTIECEIKLSDLDRLKGL